MTKTCQDKQLALLQRFNACDDDRDRYRLIIELGRKLPLFPQDQVEPANLVRGCQSQTYLYAQSADGLLNFKAQSDALISAGLAALLVAVYNEESASTILTCPPDFIRELQLTRYLTPSRSNGFFAVHLRMQQDAVRMLAQNPTEN